MELVEKGATANLETFKQLMTTLSWIGDKDLDMGILLEFKDAREPDFLYFGKKGDLNGPFFIQIGADAGVGDTTDAGGNKEQLKIMNLDQYRQLHLCIWDYGAIKAGGQTARFDDKITIQVLDDMGNSHSVSIPADVTQQMGNCVCIATIDNSSPMGAKFVNQSIIGTVKEFKEMGDWLTGVAVTTG